jgi:kumamolisin
MFDDRRRAQVTLVVRRRRPCGKGPSRPGAAMSREQFAERHAAHADDLAAVEEFARGHGFEVVGCSPAARTVVVEGEKAAVERAFAPPPGEPAGTPPPGLTEVAQTVIGLSHHPAARAHLPAGGSGSGSSAYAAPRFTCPEVAALYRFPEADCAGRTIGVVCLAGGFHQEDLAAFAASISQPPPEVTVVGVQGGANDPVPMEELASLARYLADPAGGEPPPSDAAVFTLETTMDIELALGYAPGAKVVAYFAPTNDEQGFYQALSAAVFDSENRPATITLSWGWPESDWSEDETRRILPAMEDLLLEAGAQGVTFCASSGDDGAGGLGQKMYVQYPASSPYALGCGGTEIEVEDGEIVRESAWSQAIAGQVYSTGGGLSDLFERPAWQDGIALLDPANRRGVPDVAALADRTTGVAIVAGGETISGGGTSAVAPLWAALALRLGAALGCPLGHAPSCLYAAAARDPGCFRDVTAGGNAAYQASSGWDAVTGLGSPDGERIVAALRRND